MRLFQGGGEVDVLPDCAKCTADEEQRSPFDIDDDDCPIGEEFCSGDCYYYTEDWDDNE